MHNENARYHLGLPAWGFPGWSERYFPRPRDGKSALHYYAQVFNTVEGNTTFYRVPDKDTLLRWRDAVTGRAFRFSFKLPKTVTHQRRPSWDDLRQFMSVMELLEEELGPFLLQFPATLSPSDLSALEALLERLPAQFRYVLELRHPDFFTQPQIVEPLLEKYNAGRVMFDSRPIYQGDGQHPDVLAARHKKPDVPLLDEVYNGLVYARVVLHPDTQYNSAVIEEWLQRTTDYLNAGHTVYFMVHCPNNQHCPAFAEAFHQALRSRPGIDLAALPPWPVPQQNSLF